MESPAWVLRVHSTGFVISIVTSAARAEVARRARRSGRCIVVELMRMERRDWDDYEGVGDVSWLSSAFRVRQGFPFGLASFLDFRNEEPWGFSSTVGVMMGQCYMWVRDWRVAEVAEKLKVGDEKFIGGMRCFLGASLHLANDAWRWTFFVHLIVFSAPLVVSDSI